MNIDQLTKFERLRLEALSQAQNMTVITSNDRPTKEQIFENARDIEKFLLEANIRNN